MARELRRRRYRTRIDLPARFGGFPGFSGFFETIKNTRARPAAGGGPHPARAAHPMPGQGAIARGLADIRENGSQTGNRRRERKASFFKGGNINGRGAHTRDITWRDRRGFAGFRVYYRCASTAPDAGIFPPASRIKRCTASTAASSAAAISTSAGSSNSAASSRGVGLRRPRRVCATPCRSAASRSERDR